MRVTEIVEPVSPSDEMPPGITVPPLEQAPPPEPPQPGMSELPGENSMEIIPLPSNGFDVGVQVSESFFASPALLVVVGALLLVAAVGAAVLSRRAGLKSIKPFFAASVASSLLSLVAFTSALVLLSPTTAAASLPGSPADMVEWAETTYSIDISEAQAVQVLAGNPITVEYLGSRNLVSGALAADGKLYFLNLDGFELPAEPIPFGTTGFQDSGGEEFDMSDVIVEDSN